MIRLVTFDLDDTLWDVAPVIVQAERALQEWLEQRAPALAERYSMMDLKQLMADLVAAEPALAHQISHLRILALEQALQHSGHDRAEAVELARAGFAVFLQARHRVRYFEHVRETLERLSRHYIIGAITNGNADIRRLTLAPYFDFALAAEQLQASKPAPDLFLAALERAGTDPSAAVHVGDHVEHDIQGAQAVGMHTVWVNHERRPWPGGLPPSATIHRLDQLPQVVAQLAPGQGLPTR